LKIAFCLDSRPQIIRIIPDVRRQFVKAWRNAGDANAGNMARIDPGIFNLVIAIGGLKTDRRIIVWARVGTTRQNIRKTGTGGRSHGLTRLRNNTREGIKLLKTLVNHHPDENSNRNAGNFRSRFKI